MDMSIENPNHSPSIPVVDFSAWVSPAGNLEKRKAVSDALVQAGRQVGFAYLSNHGLPEALLAEAFQWTKKLFDLSLDDKMKAPHPPGAAVHRGYSSIGLEKVSQAIIEEGDERGEELIKNLRAVPDFKESYEVGSEDFEAQPNVWVPEDTLPGFKQFMTKFYWSCAEVAQRILKCIALGLGIDDESLLLKSHTGLNNQLRLLHYPPVAAELVRAGKIARMPAHSDWSSITMLFQDDCGGLEVESPETPGQFLAAKPIKNTLIMNIGDLLTRWSNDKLKSTSHRVTLPPNQADERMTQARYSIPYFVAPDPDAVVACLPNCSDKESPSIYEPITQAAYCQMRAAAHYE
ncbi:MAG: hypothetical protein M1814_005082 [Vezdaea aestivalis]|nr:MAG: hypothetical protein M1814_005082 [Vezdaea aestivalis]